MSNPLIRINRDYNVCSKVTLTPNQVDGVEFLLSHFNSILNFKAGEGKCVKGDTRVQTERGYVKIESLLPEASDGISPIKLKVSTRNGEKTAYNFYKQSNCRLLTAKLSNGTEINGTSKHRVLSIGSNGVPSLERMDSLKVGDPVLVSVNRNHWETSSRSSLSNIDFYCLGLFLGNECINKRGSISDYYVEGDKEVILSLKNKVPVNFGNAYETSLGFWRLNFSSSYKILFQKVFNSSKDYFIPEEIYKGSFEQKLWFLLGVIDYVGVFSNSHMVISLTSQELLKGITEIAQSCGLSLSISNTEIVRGEFKGKIYYRLHLDINSIKVLCELDCNWSYKLELIRFSRVSNKISESTEYQYLTIDSIRESVCDVYDIEVPDGNEFMAQGLANHNTLTILTALHHILNYRKDIVVVIVCPKAATTIFIKEMKEKLHQPLSIRTTEIQQTQKGSRVFLFNYSRVDDLEKFLKISKEKKFKIVAAFDECHKMMSDSSSLSKKLRALRPQFDCVYGMTATMILNDVEGLFNVVDFIRPGYLGSIYNFRNRYMVYEKKRIKVKGRSREIHEVVGYKNLPELKSLISKICIVRGRSYNLSFDFHSVPLTQVEEDEYAYAAKGLYGEGYDLENEKAFGARIHDLQRVADGSLNKDINYIPSKIKLLVSLCKKIVQMNESCIIYTEYEDTYRFIQKYLEKYKKQIGYRRLFIVTGKVADNKRREAETEMRCKDVVIITKAGTESINLQQANHLIYYNIPFAIGAIIQSVGRIARMDSKYDTQYVHVIEASDTVDTYKRLLFQERKELIEELLGPEPNLPSMTDLDRESIMKMKRFMKNKFLWRRC